jgi:selenoprotein W-related protein
MLRSAWFAQELLYTFGEQIREMALIPDSDTAGRFEIRVEETLLWERKRDGGFPDIKNLKQKVRDIIAPERDLGHLENKP